MKIKLISILAILFAMSVGAAFAGTISIDDPISSAGKNYWPGFSTNDGMVYQGATANNSDHWGTPDIQKTNITLSHSKITGISMDVVFPEKDLWASIKPGDIFLDLNSDNVWDVVLDSPWSSAKAGTNVTDGVWTAYSVSLDYSDKTNYEYTRLSNTSTGAAITSAFSALSLTPTTDYDGGGYGGGIPRYDHPVAAREALLTNALGTVKFSGWLNDISNSNSMSIIWDLSGLDIHATNLTLGFAVSCANDNVLAQTGPIPNPEPGTMLLMGAGALGVGFLRRRKAAKS